MSENTIAIHWFRQDLRLSDNPALTEASKHNKVLPIYILNERKESRPLGEASNWWLHKSLNSLNKSLNNNLMVYKGDPVDIFKNLVKKYDIKNVYWNRCYEPWHIHSDKKIKEDLKGKGIHVNSFNASLLWEPWTIKKENNTPYKVFTPFYKKGCLNAKEPRTPLPTVNPTSFFKEINYSLSIKELNLISDNSWSEKFNTYWSIGEQGAYQRLQEFLKKGLKNYIEGRNFPSKYYVSRLSPHLHFGEISPNQVWHSVKDISDDNNMEHFCSELGWREFSYSQLFYNPDLPNKNLQPKFNYFPWREDQTSLEAWKKGKTGIPLVDAGMRELWETGYMHNRVRMIVGSFLVKNLCIHWKHGEKWFWNTLLDADLANNSASWQWIAGCGADAAPYFRIFNPVTQGEKFDPEGIYIRRFLPEISNLPTKYIFQPWNAPDKILKEANVKLGETYPYPIVDLKKSREDALNAFQTLKQHLS